MAQSHAMKPLQEIASKHLLDPSKSRSQALTQSLRKRCVEEILNRT